MKKLLFPTLLFATLTLSAQTHPSLPAKPNYIRFTENKGQVSDQSGAARPDVLYSGENGSMQFHLRKTGISYQLNRVDSRKPAERDSSILLPDRVTLYRVDMEWLDAQQAPVSHDTLLPGFDNYYLPVCPGGITQVRSFSGVTYNDIYPGIDLHYYTKNGKLEYDYLVAPHTGYQQIRIKVNGAKIFRDKNGSLRLVTPLGEIEEGAPVAYQNGKRLPARWVVNSDVLSFEVDGYDPSLPLVIDPVTRAWGTYYGTNGDDYGWSCSTDRFGNIFICGTTFDNSSNMATSGAFQTTSQGGYDAFVARFDAAGNRLWSTYYGCINDDNGYSCCSDASGNVFVLGDTRGYVGDSTFSTPGCHQPGYGGSLYDAFLAKFDANGIRIWGTYYGGAGEDHGTGCVTDALGNVFIAGYTNTTSGTAIATSGAHQSSFGGGAGFDGYLAKFNSAGVRQWGTYYGGNQSDFMFGCATDGQSIYICGTTRTTSVTPIATIGSHQDYYEGNGDAYLAKFNTNGIRQWGTYYGGTDSDDGKFCTVDTLSGNVYLAGSTLSLALIATSGAHQSSYGGDVRDGFLVQFDSSGVRQWGTYYGGSGLDDGFSCATDLSGNVYLVGRTTSTDVGAISTPGSHQPTIGGPIWDGYLTCFNSSGVRQWGTYYGGPGYDYCESVVINAWNCVYVSGVTASTTNSGTSIATTGSFQPASNGNLDAFLVKFNDCVPVSVTSSAQTNVRCFGGNDGAASVSVTGGSGFYYAWYPFGGNADTTSGLPAGTYTFTAINSCGSGADQVITITQPPVLVAQAQAAPNSFCSPGITTLSVNAGGGSGPLAFSWPANNISTNIFSDSVFTSTQYYAVVTDTNGCTVSDSVLVRMNTPPVVNLGNDTTVCAYSWVFDAQHPGSTYHWNTNATTQTILVYSGGYYSVTVTDSNQCIGRDTIHLVLNTPSYITFLLADSACTSDGVMNLNAFPVGGSFSGNGVSGTVFDPSVTGTGLQLITYTYTNASGCTTTQTDSLYVDACAGMAESNISPISVMINNGQCSVSVSQPATMNVLNDLGQLVLSATLRPGQNLLPGTFQTGVYVFSITTNEGVFTQKLLVRH